MSLDVYLRLQGARTQDEGGGIFIREGGSNREITREEWNGRFPDREPVAVIGHDPRGDDRVFHHNITHNLTSMARAAGIYAALWYPEDNGIAKAAQLVDPLTQGLLLLQSDPERFKLHNPSNGWGDYDGFVAFVETYLSACIEYPDAEVSVSR